MKNSPGKSYSPSLKYVLMVIAIFNGLLGMQRVVRTLAPSELYNKDIAQEYLMARAVLNGGNPYLPVVDLAEIWLPNTGYNAIQHPSLHPPLACLLSLPLGFLSYRGAIFAWLFFELVLWLATILLIYRWFDGATRWVSGLILLVMSFGVGPANDEFHFGQLNTCLLLLLVGSWLNLRKGREGIGGALLGGAIALKWIAWPLVLFLLLRRKWKGVVTSAAVVSLVNLVAISVLGSGVVKDYYLKAPLSASRIHSFEFNLAVSALGSQLFSELGWYYKFLPLWHSPSFATISSVLITVAVLLVGLSMALRASNFDTAFGLLTGLSILASPVAWSYYLLLATIPFAILVRRLRDAGFPRPFSTQVFVLLLPFLLPSPSFAIPLNLFSRQVTPEGITVIHFPLGLVLMIPTLSLICLLWFVWRTDAAQAPQSVLSAWRTETPQAANEINPELEIAVSN